MIREVRPLATPVSTTVVARVCVTAQCTARARATSASCPTPASSISSEIEVHNSPKEGTEGHGQGAPMVAWNSGSPTSPFGTADSCLAWGDTSILPPDRSNGPLPHADHAGRSPRLVGRIRVAPTVIPVRIATSLEVRRRLAGRRSFPSSSAAWMSSGVARNSILSPVVERTSTFRGSDCLLAWSNSRMRWRATVTSSASG